VTASILARDPVSGELGVAVFTGYPSVGMRVPFAEPGVGAVATQAMAERSFGPRGLELLRGGTSPAAVVDELIGADLGSPVRQLGVLSASGESAGFTGDACVEYAEEITGEHCRCQANTMATPGVPDAMRAAFESTDGELSVRLLAALIAGDAAGGDARGRMSAALLVVPADGEPWRKTVDLRVDHHPEPLSELTRALNVHRAYALLDLAADRGRAGDIDGATQAGMQALALAPEDGQLLLWMGLGVADGNLDLGVTLVQRALELQPSLAMFLDRIPEATAPAAPALRRRLSASGA
jgi:uncharacterized Ntn-hydrolase superfamily protein